jgi:hypothetical protein
MTHSSRIQSIFFWILWTIGICGLFTILYGYFTGELSDHNPFFMLSLVGFFTLSPLAVLIE